MIIFQLYMLRFCDILSAICRIMEKIGGFAAMSDNLITTTCASQHGTAVPRFLWFPIFPYKKVAIVAGESGIAKSTFVMNIAARLTNGQAMPFCDGESDPELGNVLYLNKEDDIEETINPRFIAMGANLERIHYVSENFVFDGDFKRLEDTIKVLKIKFVIIDPLTSFLGKNYNMNTAQSIGTLMRDLSRVAFNTGVAIAIVSHVTKNPTGSEINRHLGSSDIINAARSVLSVTREDADIDVMTVKHLKSTLAKRAQTFYYEIIDNGIIEFSDAPEIDDEKVISASKVELAQEMIYALLANGEMYGRDVTETIKNAGIGKSAIDTAKRIAGVESIKTPDGWLWRLPG